MKGYGRETTPKTTHAPGTAAGDSALSSAVDELHKQHPHPYTEQGPFDSHKILHKRPFEPSKGY